ncbi:PilN domain-containing protein [Thermodesulfobacteriota bacterium]
MIKINLLADREAVKKEGTRRQLGVFIAVLVVDLVLIGAVHIVLRSKINDVKSDIKTVNAELEILQKTVGKVDEFKKQKRILQEKLDVIQMLTEDKFGPVIVMDELSGLIPDTIWLETMKKKGNSLALKGVAIDNESIARFMRELEESEYFAQVELKFTKHRVMGELALMDFELSCSVLIGG